jgi:DNA invertase Pin-like site-specific DNA recombinase
MDALRASLDGLRRAALSRAAERHKFRFTAQDVEDALARQASLKRAMIFLARRQSADILLGYSLGRFGRFLARRMDKVIG